MAVTKYFEVRNNQQTLIINDTFENFYLEKKITNLTPTQANPDDTIHPYGIPTTMLETALYFHHLGEFLVFVIDTHQNKRFMAVSAPDMCVMTFRQDPGRQAVIIYPRSGAPGFSGGGFTSAAARLSFWQSACQAMKIYIFTTEQPTSSSNYGLVVYKENGKVLFDANRKYMRILDCINITGTDVANNQNTDLSGYYQENAGPQSFKNIAIMGFETPWRTTWSPQATTDVAHGVYITDKIMWHMYYQTLWATMIYPHYNIPSGIFSTYHFLVVDVTNY